MSHNLRNKFDISWDDTNQGLSRPTSAKTSYAVWRTQRRVTIAFGAGYKYSYLLLSTRVLDKILDIVLEQQKARFAQPYVQVCELFVN